MFDVAEALRLLETLNAMPANQMVTLPPQEAPDGVVPARIAIVVSMTFAKANCLVSAAGGNHGIPSFQDSNPLALGESQQ
jgi:hypothetical protein